MMVLRKLPTTTISDWDKSVAWLLISAIFFALRACEYLETNTKGENRQTKILRLQNIVFRKEGKVQYSIANMESSDIVRVTFKFQKNNGRDLSVHMLATKDKQLNPVIALAETVKRVWSYNNSSEDSNICIFQYKNGKQGLILANHVRDKLKTIVDLIREESLFTSKDVGLHSICSGGGGSKAFSEYIPEQVESFTVKISQKILAFELLFVLGGNNNKQINKQTKEKQKTLQNNSVGLDRIPFYIQFSNLAVNKSSALTKGSKV